MREVNLEKRRQEPFRSEYLNQGWPKFLNEFSEIWTKARATPHH